MLFFFGTKNTGVSVTPAEITCESCKQSQQRVYVFQKYFHFCWIPTFPLGKQSVLECQHCKKTILEKEMSPPQKHISLPKRKEAKTPIYTFAGIILFACLVGWGNYSTYQKKERTKKYVASPVVNDIAIIHLEKNYEYLILKLVSIEDNTLKFLPGNFVYKSYFTAKREIEEKAEENDYFSDKPLEMSKMKYKELKVDFVQRENLAEEL